MLTCFNLSHVLMGSWALLGGVVCHFTPQVNVVATPLMCCLVSLATLSDCTLDLIPSVCNDFAVHLPPPTGRLCCLHCPKCTCQTGRAKEIQGKKKGGNRQFTVSINSIVSFTENIGLWWIKTAIPYNLDDVLITNLKHPVHQFIQFSGIKGEENVLSTDDTIESR